MPPTIPPLLEPYLILPPEGSLILVTHVQGVTANWITLWYLYALLGRGPGTASGRPSLANRGRSAPDENSLQDASQAGDPDLKGAFAQVVSASVGVSLKADGPTAALPWSQGDAAEGTDAPEDGLATSRRRSTYLKTLSWRDATTEATQEAAPRVKVASDFEDPVLSMLTSKHPGTPSLDAVLSVFPHHHSANDKGASPQQGTTSRSARTLSENSMGGQGVDIILLSFLRGYTFWQGECAKQLVCRVHGNSHYA